MKRFIAIALLATSITPMFGAHDDSEVKLKKSGSSKFFCAARGLTALYLGVESLKMLIGALSLPFNHPKEVKKIEKALSNLPHRELIPIPSGMYSYGVTLLLPYFLLKQAWGDLSYAFNNE